MTRAEQIIQVLKDYPWGISANDIADITGMTRQNTLALLEDDKLEGWHYREWEFFQETRSWRWVYYYIDKDKVDMLYNRFVFDKG